MLVLKTPLNNASGVTIKSYVIQLVAISFTYILLIAP
jgi:hypothetical protein